MAVSICFNFHMIAEDNGAHHVRRISISIKGLKTDQQFLAFRPKESAIISFLIVENNKSNYLKVL